MLRAYTGASATFLCEWRACGRPWDWLRLERCRCRSLAHHRENTDYPHLAFRRWRLTYFPLWEGV